MKIRWPFILLSFIASIALLTCCATTKVNWDNRVGHFTYDQAVAELGTPDHVEILTGGAITADWHTHRTSARSVGVGIGVSSGPVGVGLGAPVSSAGARALRLSFGPDKILKSWSR